jgi:hypothetical protein
MASAFQAELDKLETLRGRYAATNKAILSERDKIVQATRAIGETRIAAVLDAEANPPRVVEAKVKRLEGEVKVAEAELQKLTPEAAALSGAIVQLEASVLPKRHAERLAKQVTVQEQYRAVVRRIVDAANALATASEEARTLYNAAHSEYPTDELSDGQAIVLRHAGLAQVWDASWVNAGSNPTKRDFLIGQIWDWDRSLVDASDPTAKYKVHQENHRKQWHRQLEEERQRRVNPSANPSQDGPRRPMTASQRMSGELVNDQQTVIRVWV